MRWSASEIRGWLGKGMNVGENQLISGEKCCEGPSSCGTAEALQVAEDANGMFIQEEDKRQEATAHHFLYEIHTPLGPGG